MKLLPIAISLIPTLLSSVLVFSQGQHATEVIAQLPLRELLVPNSDEVHFLDEHPALTVQVLASKQCLVDLDKQNLIQQADRIVRAYNSASIRVVSLICSPPGLGPHDIVIGFAQEYSGICPMARVSMSRLTEDGRFLEPIKADSWTYGSFRVLGFLGKVNDPWGFIIQGGECGDASSTVWYLSGEKVRHLLEWSSPILVLVDGETDVVWLQATGIHRHGSEPLVIWKVFRNARNPELIDQQFEWTAVDDQPGRTMRIRQDFWAFQKDASRSFPQALP